MPDSMREGKGTRNAPKKQFVWKKNDSLFALCSYSDVDAVCLRRAIDAATKAGGAIMLGLTQDGGAFSVCLLLNDQKVKEYPHSASELQDMLDSLTSELAGV